MTDDPGEGVINYRTNEDWYWDGRYSEVRFQAYRNKKTILCRVTQEWIEDNLDNPDGAEACLDAAKVAFDSITDTIGNLIGAEVFQSDGSVLLKSYK